jgi:hypothetical protein
VPNVLVKSIRDENDRYQQQSTLFSKKDFGAQLALEEFKPPVELLVT